MASIPKLWQTLQLRHPLSLACTLNARKVIALLTAGFICIALLGSCVPLALVSLSAPQPSPSPAPSSRFAVQYYSPLQNAQYVSKAATIVVRYGPVLSNQNLQDLQFTVQGSKSGLHTGQTVLADDHKTVIFKPAVPFTPGEKVAVSVNGLQLSGQNTYPPISYSFTVAVNQQSGTPGSGQLADPPLPKGPPRSAFPDFLTVPQDIPHYTLSKTSPDTGEGDIFLAPFYWTKAEIGSYLLIFNNEGQLVYFRSVTDALDAWDFKVQPDGTLSYYDQKDSTFYVLNSHYQVVNTYQAGDGYTADLHDLQILPNGDALLMIYDAEAVDMSKVIPGGNKNATVTGLVIQELDPSKNVIFEWRSWDHFAFSDSLVNLTDQQIDLVHGNSLALANDGNLLLSSRNLSEITKINLQTGDMIWRLGGKANMFTIADGDAFAFQHDVRQLPNGNITVFDNQGTPESPAASLGAEYMLDETTKTATRVWSFSDVPPVFATYMGDTQRLPDGNTVLGWGAPATATGYIFSTMTEVAPDGQVLFDFIFDQPYVSYRAFRFPWQGFPDTPPALAYKVDGNRLILGYSWNGATEVASYQLYAGDSPQSLGLIEENSKTDFETQSSFAGLRAGQCYFQVAALDKNRHEMARSAITPVDLSCPAAH